MLKFLKYRSRKYKSTGALRKCVELALKRQRICECGANIICHKRENVLVMPTHFDKRNIDNLSTVQTCAGSGKPYIDH